MQETQPLPIDGKATKKLQEFFEADIDQKVIAKMNDRLMDLEPKGHTLVRRVKIGRNDPCPCGSGKKFKRCHLESSKKA